MDIDGFLDGEVRTSGRVRACTTRAAHCEKARPHVAAAVVPVGAGARGLGCVVWRVCGSAVCVVRGGLPCTLWRGAGKAGARTPTSAPWARRPLPKRMCMETNSGHVSRSSGAAALPVSLVVARICALAIWSKPLVPDVEM